VAASVYVRVFLTLELIANEVPRFCLTTVVNASNLVPSMTREELLAKKRELRGQIDALEHKIKAIDEVLELFPVAEERTLTLPGIGPYAGMSAAQAIRALLKLHEGRFVTPSEMAKELERGGVETKSSNFANLVGVTCFRLSKSGAIKRQRINGRTTFGLESNSQ